VLVIGSVAGKGSKRLGGQDPGKCSEPIGGMRARVYVFVVFATGPGFADERLRALVVAAHTNPAQVTDAQAVLVYPHDVWISLCTANASAHEIPLKPASRQSWRKKRQSVEVFGNQHLGRETWLS
jgi:hypothetical protein